MADRTQDLHVPASCNEGSIGGLLEGLQTLLGVVHLNDVHLLANARLNHVDVEKVELVQLLQQVVVKRVRVCMPQTTVSLTWSYL